MADKVGKDYAVRGRSLWQMALSQQQTFALAASVGNGDAAQQRAGYTSDELVVRLYAAGFGAWHGDAERGGKVGPVDWHWCAVRGGRALADWHEFAHAAAHGTLESCIAKCCGKARAKSRGDKVRRWRYDGGVPMGGADAVLSAARANVATGIAEVMTRLGDDAYERVDATPSLRQALAAVGFASSRELAEWAVRQ